MKGRKWRTYIIESVIGQLVSEETRGREAVVRETVPHGRNAWESKERSIVMTGGRQRNNKRERFKRELGRR